MMFINPRKVIFQMTYAQFSVDRALAVFGAIISIVVSIRFNDSLFYSTMVLLTVDTFFFFLFVSCCLEFFYLELHTNFSFDFQLLNID